MSSCSCPFCPLLAVNLHIDAAIVEFRKNNSALVITGNDYRSTEPLNETAKDCLAKVVQFVKSKTDIKMGDVQGYENDEAHFRVIRLSKWKYILSFHAKHKEDGGDPV